MSTSSVIAADLHLFLKNKAVELDNNIRSQAFSLLPTSHLSTITKVTFFQPRDLDNDYSLIVEFQNEAIKKHAAAILRHAGHPRYPAITCSDAKMKVRNTTREFNPSLAILNTVLLNAKKKVHLLKSYDITHAWVNGRPAFGVTLKGAGKNDKSTARRMIHPTDLVKSSPPSHSEPTESPKWSKFLKHFFMDQLGFTNDEWEAIANNSRPTVNSILSKYHTSIEKKIHRSKKKMSNSQKTNRSEENTQMNK